MVVQSTVHRPGTLTWPRATISVTLGALLSRLVRPIRERIWWYVRVGATETPMFEHPYAHPALHGAGKPAHSSSGSPQPTP